MEVRAQAQLNCNFVAFHAKNRSTPLPPTTTPTLTLSLRRDKRAWLKPAEAHGRVMAYCCWPIFKCNLCHRRRFYAHMTSAWP